MSIISRVKDLDMFKEDGYCFVGVIGSDRFRVENYIRYLCSGEDVKIRRKDRIELTNGTVVAGYGRAEQLIGRKFAISIVDSRSDEELIDGACSRTVNILEYHVDFNTDIQDYRCETELREGMLE